MTAKKEETKPEVVEKPVETPETKPVDETPTETKDLKEDEIVDDLKVGAGADDTAIDYSKGISSSEAKKATPIDESDESNKIVEDDKSVKEAVNKGELGGFTSDQLSVLNKPMVADPVTNKPVYETAYQAQLAQSAAGKLGTPGPDELPKED